MRTACIQLLLLFSFLGCNQRKEESALEDTTGTSPDTSVQTGPEKMVDPEILDTFQSFYFIESDDAPQLEDYYNNYKEVKRGLDKIKLKGKEYYVVEGDMLLTEEELEDYLQYLYLPRRESFGKENKILIRRKWEDTIVWPPNTKLRYCIFFKSFPTEAHYQIVRTAMENASKEWMKTCGIRFEYVPRFDRHRAPHRLMDSLDFIIQYQDILSSYMTAAFNPETPKKDRYLYIFPQFYTFGYHKTGLLRHEIGHILGFYHTHNLAGGSKRCLSSSWPALPPDTITIGSHDSLSVMSYPCGANLNHEYRITKKDSVSVIKLYGPPLLISSE